MVPFLILMYLLSLSLGYAAAFGCSTKALWKSVRNDRMPDALQIALSPPWAEMLLDAVYAASFLGLGYGFWKFGFFPGAAIAFCFMVAAKIGEMFLLHKMRSAFHLNIVLRAVLRSQAEYMQTGEMVQAKALECVIEKVALELNALRAVKSATLAPVYAGQLGHLKVPCAKSDNYHSCTRTQKGT